MRSWLTLAVIAALLAALPLVGNNYALRLATTVFMYSVMAQSWNFIGGLAGYPSFATAAFFGLGAYASAILQNHAVPMVPAWACAGVAALLFAAFLGGAILHLRGHYFAIASLIVAEMLREIVNTLPDFTGGGKGMNLPLLKLSVTAQAQFFFYAMLALAVLTVATAIVIHRSKLGFGLRCIQQNESAADIIGKKNVSLDIGPTRHGITRGQTIYFFDPSGNRNEVFSGGYMYNPDMPTIEWTMDELGRAIFYPIRELNERFLTVMT